MKTFSLILTFLASTALASTGTFFVSHEGTLKPISHYDLFGKYCFVLDDHRRSIPSYTLNDGIITEDSQNKNILGNINGYFVIGKQDNDFKPFKVQLDSKSKVVNINTHLCRSGRKDSQIFLLSRDISSKSMGCSHVDVYFLPLWEAWRRNTGNW